MDIFFADSMLWQDKIYGETTSHGLRGLVVRHMDLTTWFDSPLPQASGDALAFPPGFFSPPKKDFLCLLMIKHDHKPVATLWHALRVFFPTKIRLLHALIWYSTITQSQLGTARRRAFNLGHIPDQHAQEKISA